MYSEQIEKMLKKRGINPGDEIKLITSKGAFEGVLIPKPEFGDKEVIIIKLKSGYNVGIKADGDVEIAKLSGRKETFTLPTVDIKPNKKLPEVTIIATGGTIGSRVDYETGGVYMTTKPEELLYLVPELSAIADIKINNLMGVSSEDMTYDEWLQIANAVSDALDKGSKGVVVLHGTDIMHYSSSALSFMLEGLNAPVVVTGAQRSTDRGSSDGFMNLTCAVHLAAESDIAEVGVCMHANSSDNFCFFTRGTKVRKMHTSRRDAFRPINSAPIAKVTAEGSIEYLSGYKKRDAGKGKLKVLSKFEPKVALLKFYPNSDPEIIDYCVGKGFRGIIIEGTGLGHVAVAPKDEKYSWLGHIEKAVSAGLVVGVTSQCINGRVNANVYRNLRLISKTGAIYCEDMLSEVALVKLGFLLGNYGKEKAAEMLNKNIVGEITRRTETDWY
jgi:glutamyl-tRNA(Gln) amidotransferase subunit D